MSERFVHPEQITSPADRFTLLLEAALNTLLSAENIDSYADDALDNVVDIVEDVLNEHHASTYGVYRDTKDQERAAFRFYGLESIETILDHIVNKGEELRELDKLIASLPCNEQIIVPPDKIGAQITVSSGDYTQTNMLPRLKTVLFVLANEFELDPHNKHDVILKKGTLNDGMMRKSSYVSVQIPELERTILVCDEVGNITFVFNTNALEEQGIRSSDLLDFTKQELKKLIEQNPSLGTARVYSSKFVGHLVGDLKNQTGLYEIDKDYDQRGAGQYLKTKTRVEKAPEGWLSKKRLRKSLKVTAAELEKAIELSPYSEDDFLEYKFQAITTVGYSPEQQSTLKIIIETNCIRIPKANDGWFSQKNIADELGVDPSVIKSIAEELKDELGEVVIERFGANVAPSYSPEQQKVIKEFAINNNRICEAAPPGFASVNGIATQIGISRNSVDGIIKEASDMIGDIQIHQYGPNNAHSYSPEQIEIIKTIAESRGFFSEVAPEGWLNIHNMATEFGVSNNVISKTVAQMKDSMGEVLTYRYGARITKGYSPEQQEMIRRKLVERGTIT